MTPDEVIELIKERMLCAEVPITHSFLLKLSEDGCYYLTDEGG